MHFVYAWSGCLAAVGFFGAVNESVWEHLKLLLWPSLAWWLVVVRSPAAAAAAAYVGMVLMVNLYYGLLLGFGVESLASDVGVFALSVFAGQAVGVAVHAEASDSDRHQAATADCVALALLAALLAALATFTLFWVPSIGWLFGDPRDDGFGVRPGC
jgi:hypothetical protein